jgi:oligopeptide/dipeptide ABC transporter ATP-binding protein
MTADALVGSALVTVPQPVLEVRGLRFSVGDSVSVGPLDLTVPVRSALGIVGETGSGKSLLCRALTGMLPSLGGRIDAGSLVFDGRDLARADGGTWRAARRGGIGFMPQASLSSLNPVRRIGAQMHETLKLQGIRDRAERRRRAHALLEQVRLKDPARVLGSYPHQLSGGMRQRVMLALAIAGDSKLVITDEPTTALDATVQSEVVELLRDVQRERQVALIAVSHDIKVIRRLCATVAVMYAGRFVEVGPTAQVLDSPHHPYTKGLLASDPALVPRGSRLGAIGGQPPAAAEWHTGGCPFAPRCRFVTDVCRAEDPALGETNPGRLAACHHVREVAAS